MSHTLLKALRWFLNHFHKLMRTRKKNLSYSLILRYMVVSAFTLLLSLSFLSLKINSTPLKISAFFGIGLVLYLLSVFFAESINRPIRILTKQARDLSNKTQKDGVRFVLKTNSIELLDLADSLNKLSHKLEISAQLARKNEHLQKQFLSDVSHELKTPLTALKGSAELLLSNPDMPFADRKRFLNIIVSESDRLTHMTQDLLTLMHIDDRNLLDSKLQPVKLKTCAQHAARTLESLLQEKDLQLIYQGDCGLIDADPSMMMQVMINLIENAYRFTPEHCSIHLDFSENEQEVIMSIWDEGPGFGDIDPKLLFQRFYQNNPSRSRMKTGGTGLGLSIVQSIVLAHKGNIEARSLENAGACFTLRFPKHQATYQHAQT